MGKGFIIDGTTKQAIIDVAERLLKPGEINLGWDDISNVLRQDGETVVSLGRGTGRNRTFKACEDALASYRTATTAEAATKILLQITGPADLLLKDVQDVLRIMREAISPTAEVIYGVTRDLNLDDEIEVTLCGGFLQH